MSYRTIGNAAVSALGTTVRYPRVQRPTSKYPVMLLHGAGNSVQWESYAIPAAVTLAAVLARGSAATNYQGIPCISHNLGGDQYGAPIVTNTYIPGMHAYIAAQTGCSSAKRIDVGISMGGGTALLDAIANPGAVAAIAAMIPMANVNSLYKQNPGGPINGGFTTVIGAAWGVTTTVLTVTLTNGSAAVVATSGSFTAAMASGQWWVVKNTGVRGAYDTTIPIGTTISAYTDASHATMSAPFTGTTGSYQIVVAQPLPSGADIIGQASALAGIPTRLYYSTVDLFIDPADVIALAAAIGSSAEAIAVDSTYGHGNGTIAEVGAYNGGSLYSDLVSWLVSNGA